MKSSRFHLWIELELATYTYSTMAFGRKIRYHEALDLAY